MKATAQDAVQHGESAHAANLWARQLARLGSQWCKFANGGDLQEREEVGVQQAHGRESAIRRSLQ